MKAKLSLTPEKTLKERLSQEIGHPHQCEQSGELTSVVAHVSHDQRILSRSINQISLSEKSNVKEVLLSQRSSANYWKVFEMSMILINFNENLTPIQWINPFLNTHCWYFSPSRQTYFWMGFANLLYELVNCHLPLVVVDK